MKKLLVTIVVVMSFISTSCTFNNSVSSNFETYTQSSETSLSIEQDLANRFKTNASGFGKELEDAWKADPENEQLAAMYYYYNAKFYISIDESEMACNEMSNISPNYSGIMSAEIISYGIELFGDYSIWNSQNSLKEDHKSTITDTKRQEIKDWITQRYDYYDSIEGDYAGDKYTETIFNEAAEKFGFTYEEINNIWSNLPL